VEDIKKWLKRRGLKGVSPYPEGFQKPEMRPLGSQQIPFLGNRIAFENAMAYRKKSWQSNANQEAGSPAESGGDSLQVQTKSETHSEGIRGNVGNDQGPAIGAGPRPYPGINRIRLKIKGHIEFLEFKPQKSRSDYQVIAQYLEVLMELDAGDYSALIENRYSINEFLNTPEKGTEIQTAKDVRPAISEMESEIRQLEMDIKYLKKHEPSNLFDQKRVNERLEVLRSGN